MENNSLAILDYQLPAGYKAIDERARQKMAALIEWAGNALELTPAIPLTELEERAATWKAKPIDTAADLECVSALRREIVDAINQVATAAADGPGPILYRLHREKVGAAHRIDGELRVHLQTVNDLLRDYNTRQQIAAEAERRRLQAEADAAAKAEQDRREKEAKARLEDERAIRLEAEAREKTARSIAAKAAAEKLAEAAREREQLARLDAATVKAEPVQPVFIQRREVEKPAGVVFKRPVWVVRAIDIEVLPRQYCLPDDKKIAAVVKALGAEHGITGVTVAQEAGGVVTKAGSRERVFNPNRL